jgi:hypothetical protein
MELPTLVGAIKAGRVKADTWLHLDQERRWVPAAQVPELRMFFRGSAAGGAAGGGAVADKPGSQLKPGMLRRIKLLADLDDRQLDAFIQVMETLKVPQFGTVVTAGAHGDAMYLVLEGEVRARKMIDGRETTLSTLGIGEFFGEVSVLDHGPRSADVVANQPSVLLKISAASLERLLRESPDVAAPFLYSLSRFVVGRFRTVTKKYEDSVHFARVAGRAG